MCLTTRQICPLKAKRDITVYKILKINPLGKLYTPCTYVEVKVGETMDASCQKTQEYSRKLVSTKHQLLVKEIGGGMIHSYVDENFALVMTNWIDYKWAIVKCTIPKGTLYYISFNNTQICSKKLIINKIIHSNERKSQKD